MPTLFITGANRGIGLEFARQYLASGWTVIAGCRAPETATALTALEAEHPGRLTVERLEVNDAAAVEAAAAKHKGHAIDLLINNAGIYGARDAALAISDFDQFQKVLVTNAIGPMRVTLALLPSLRLAKGSKIATLSSRMGSIALSGGGSYVYRASKAAINAAMHSLALDLKPWDVTCILLHPGWVRTDMGGQGADIPVAESVTGLKQVIDGATIKDTGKFFNYTGEEFPW